MLVARGRHHATGPQPTPPQLRAGGGEGLEAFGTEANLGCMPVLFQILHLLAELLDDALQLQADIGQLDIV